MIYLRQSTASQEIPLGPFLDATDGNTEEAGLSISSALIRIWKSGSTSLVSKNSGGATHLENGIYYATLDATDTDTLGSMIVYCHVEIDSNNVNGALYTKQECLVLPANVYDSMIAGSDNLQVDTIQISGDTTAADNLELDYDGTGYNKSNSTIGTCTTNADMRGTDNAFLAASAPTNFSDLAITATTGRVDINTNNDKSGYTISGTLTTLDALDTAQDSQHATTQSTLSTISSNVTLIQTDVSTITGADGATLATTQPATTWGAITVTAGDGTDNITIAGSGSGDGLAFTRSGSGGLYDTAWASAVESEVTDALNAYDPPTRSELTSDIGTVTTAISSLNDVSVTDILTTQMTESYAADGTAPTLAQALMLIQQSLGDFTISGTTLTVRRLDGSTTAATFTLDDATSPTGKTRAT